MLKTGVLVNICVEKIIFKILLWTESSKETEIEDLELKTETDFFFNSEKVFTVTSDKFYVSLLNNSINFFQKKDPEPLNGSVDLNISEVSHTLNITKRSL